MSIPTGLPVSHVGADVAGVMIITGSPTVFIGSTVIGLTDRLARDICHYHCT